MTTGAPVLVDVVCPACDGVGAALDVVAPAPRPHVARAMCAGRGEVPARLAEAVADTERPPPGDAP